jgi:peptidoglycan L-alanyl-D-glutamate endopeptidase CwlK
MDAVTLSRIKLLHPVIRQEVSEHYKEANRRLGKNVRLRLSHTLRTFNEQDKLYAQGRTTLRDSQGKRLNIVTNAKAGQSVHNYGLAFDMVLLLDKDGNGTFETASWDIRADNDYDLAADWMEVVNYFKQAGWIWGGDWKSFPDYPHFEKTFGHGWKTLLHKYTTGDTFTEIIEKKTYKWVNL